MNQTVDREQPTTAATTSSASPRAGSRIPGPIAATGGRLRRLVGLLELLVAAFLVLDFGFRFLAVPGGGFVDLVSRVATVLAVPFRGLGGASLTVGAHLAYWPDLAALVVYAVAAWFLESLIRVATAPRGLPGQPSA